MPRRINGLGTIIKLPNGRIRIKAQHGYLPNGNPRIITVTGTSETDCKRKLDARIRTETKTLINNANYRQITLSALCNMHLETHLNELNRLKPKAADRRESTIKNQIQPYLIGSLSAVRVTPKDVTEHIETLIREQKLSVSSIEKALDVINAAYKWAHSQGYTDYNPCTPVLDPLKNRLKNLIKRNSMDGIVHVLGSTEVSKLENTVNNAAASGGNWYLFGVSALILLETGMRVGELCALRWQDWDKVNGTLSIIHTRYIAKKRNGDNTRYGPDENGVKNNRCRIIGLSAKAISYFAKIRRLSPKTAPEDYIVLNARLTPTNPSNYGDRLNRLYRAAGLPNDVSGAHTLRRTCATRLYNAKCTVEDIAAYLGDTPETIRKYYISLTTRIIADGVVVNIVKLPTSK